MMKNKLLLLSLILLFLPFVRAYTLNFSVNTTIPYSFNTTINCTNQTNTTLFYNTTILFFDNKSFILTPNNNYSINQTLYKIRLVNNDNISDFKVNINNLNNTNLLRINFLTSFEQPEQVLLTSNLFPNQTYYVKNNMSFIIPTNLTNTSKYNISFYLPLFNKTIIKNVSFIDTQPPKISVYRLFNQMLVGGKYLIRVFYFDNSPLGKINYSTNSNALISTIKKPDYVDFLITPEEYGILDLNISLSDIYNNSVNKSFSFIVGSNGNLFLPNLNIPRLRTGKTHIFNLYKGKLLKFNITLINESWNNQNNNSKSPVVWIKTGNSQVQLPFNTTQSVVTNSLGLMLTSNYDGVFDCKIRFDYPKVIEGNHVLSFHTTFANYTLLPEENLTINGVTTNCKLVEETNFEDSKVVCSVSLPYDTVSEDTLIIIPKRDFAWYQNMTQNKINEWRDKFENQRFLKNLILIIFGIILFSGFVWIVKPEYFIGR